MSFSDRLIELSLAWPAIGAQFFAARGATAGGLSSLGTKFSKLVDKNELSLSIRKSLSCSATPSKSEARVGPDPRAPTAGASKGQVA